MIEPLVIRRTRSDIEADKGYLEDLKSQKIVFPKVGDPTSLFYRLEGNLSELFYDTVSMITGLDEYGNEVEGFGYYRYRAIEFLSKEEDKKIYGNVESISNRLSAIMRTLLVKRLESSFKAFKGSLSRLHRAIDNMINMFEEDRIFIAPDLDINKLLEEGYSFEEIEAKVNEKGGNNREFKADAFKKEFYAHLQDDKAKVQDLINRWNKVKKDPKLIEFINKIDTEFFEKKVNPSGKLVIFTESKETALELTEKLEADGIHNVLYVSADNRKNLENPIRDNFDANLPKEEWRHDYDIIITTEVLAEGVNLHKSNVIINYDVPWNSTRLMQRIGRVNRIGSLAKKIYVYNFYPSADGDKQISLVNTALRKLQAFHTAFGEDNKIFSLLEEKGEGALFGNKIKTEENEILKYLIELREFKKNHPQRYAEIVAIPNKARCGRKADDLGKLKIIESDGIEGEYPLQDSSLMYLKSDNHPGIYCLVTPDLNAREVSFLQAVKIYKASEEEKSIPLHDAHHKQTLTGLEFFKSEKNQENIQSVNSQHLSNTENKALSTLRALIKHAPTEQKKQSIIKCTDLVKKGTYSSKGLPKHINDFHKRNKVTLGKAPQTYFDSLFKDVLDKYDLSPKSTHSSTKTTPGVINPKIVLTQSFK